MNFDLIAFLVFAAITVMSAVAVISARNPVHAALFLVLTFFSTACTWLLVGAEFLGIALVLVYVGAVMVLFLFVVMMLDIEKKVRIRHNTAYTGLRTLITAPAETTATAEKA